MYIDPISPPPILKSLLTNIFSTYQLEKAMILELDLFEIDPN